MNDIPEGRAWLPSRQVERELMVQRQLVARGISNRHVVAAMAHVAREAFLSSEQHHEAYDDHACPIACGQTISQPYTVAFMAQAARITLNDRVLEIGTGSGYGAAVLSRLAKEVHSIERIPALATTASARLRQHNYDNVHVHQGNGTLGLPDFGPFDAIVVTAGAKVLPPAYRQQMVEGGRIIIPIGDSPHRQRMCRFTHVGGECKREDLGTFVFVPLVGDCGWDGHDLS